MSSSCTIAFAKSTKRALDSEDDAPEAKRGRTGKSDEDEENLMEEKLRQLQQFAEDKSTRQSPSKPSAAALSACINSHWKQIGNLMLFTAAGVTGSAKVRSTDANPIILHFRIFQCSLNIIIRIFGDVF